MTTMNPTSIPALDEIDHAIIAFIRTCIDTRDYLPSVREIGEQVGMSSPSSVHHRLRKLERAGAISRAANRSRAITVLAEPAAA